MRAICLLIALVTLLSSADARQPGMLDSDPSTTPEIARASYFVTFESSGLLVDEDTSSEQIPLHRESLLRLATQRPSLQAIPGRSTPATLASAATEPSSGPAGFLDFNTYWDTRHFFVTTLNIFVNDLPLGLEYFQFINLESPIGSDSHDWTGFFGEMNLRRPVCESMAATKALDWAAQYADGSAAEGVLRFGLRMRMDDAGGWTGYLMRDLLKLTYNITLFAIESDSSGIQLEHFYRRDFFDGGLYVSGFCDHNINMPDGGSQWVTEHQLGLRLVDPLYVVAEYRYNDFLPESSRNGLGLGLEYVARFN